MDPNVLVSEHNTSYDPLQELSLLLMSCTGTPQLNADGLQRKTKKDNLSDRAKCGHDQVTTKTLDKSKPTCPAKKPDPCGSVSTDLVQQQTEEFFFYRCPKSEKGYNIKEEYKEHLDVMDPDVLVSEHNASYDPLKELSLLMNCTGTPQLNAVGLQRKTKIDNRSDRAKCWPDQVTTKTLDKSKPTCPAKKPDPCGSVSTDLVQQQTEEFFFYRCLKCGKGYNEKEEYKEHMDSMHPVEKKHHCTECGKSFTMACLLLDHQRIHTGEKPYDCQECGKSFSSKHYLRIHQRMHTEEKPYYCKDCGKSFREQHYLTIHKRIHSGEKPYKCSYCEKCFSQNSALKVHVRQHTGEKPYSCKVCGRCFVSFTSCQKHEMNHTGHKPYLCRECGNTFSTSWNLQKHMRVHTGEKPYICKVCGKCFASFSNCQTHQKTHTSQES